MSERIKPPTGSIYKQTCHCLSFSTIESRGMDVRTIKNYANMRCIRLEYAGFKKKCKFRGIKNIRNGDTFIAHPLPCYIFKGVSPYGEREYDPVTYPIMQLEWPPSNVIFYNKNNIMPWRDIYEDKMKLLFDYENTNNRGRPFTFYEFEKKLFDISYPIERYHWPMPENPKWLE